MILASSSTDLGLRPPGNMSAIPNLYNEVVLDHIKNARNYRVMEDASRTAEGVNALCGDTLSVYVRLDGDVIRDASFQCSCCGISMASASVMTEAVKDSTVAEVLEMYRAFLHLLTEADRLEGEVDLGEVAVLATVRAFPARRNCATLAWDTLMAALEGRRELVQGR
jgi:nitrogen fixation NifU-like protein